MLFKIDRDGNVSIENVEGYGSSCLEVTARLEKALGVVDENSRVMTDEFNSPTTSCNKEQVSQ